MQAYGLKDMLIKKLSYKGYGGHGNQVRDLIHIDDVCEIILKQIKKLIRYTIKVLMLEEE